MIHFFPRFGRPAASTPFGDALRESGIGYRIVDLDARLDYPRRIQLLLLGYPRLAWAALRGAWASLFGKGGQRPDAVLLSSDVEVLAFAALRLLPGAAKPAIALMPFIYTERTSARWNRVRLAYYRFVMRRVACALCHSALEVERYRALFAGSRTSFDFVRWGTHVPLDASSRPPRPLPASGLPVVASAGRSGRDYPTLVAATAGLPCRVVIVCNAVDAMRGAAGQPHVQVRTDCFGMEYLRQLRDADVVAVPLAVSNISAGQMVLIQAMALARPLVVTDTPTINDYLTDGRTALLVREGDPEAMRAAIRRLLDDPALAEALGQAARRDYEARFSLPAHLGEVIQAIRAHAPGA